MDMQGQAPEGALSPVADANSSPLAYEVVSIKAHKPGDTSASTQGLPNGYRSINMPLSNLVLSAYVDTPGTEVSGLPEWAKTDPYDVETRVDAEAVEAWKKLPSAEAWKQQLAMMRTLLADRCKLKVHWEKKEGPVYDLVIAKDGPKFKEAAPDEVSNAIGGGSSNTQRLTVHAETMENIGWFFSGNAGRKIVDKTGLGGKRFDFEIEWTPDRAATADDPGISIFTALEEQLGLKLVPSKGPVDRLVIDHFERPTPN
ncbi:MAG: TIGR03435 family protein [Terracidiphilus sp.]